ncbi:MAG: STAS domain-containing protein [Azospirillaceae bacterium]|nr:STAS domain-containing protein [Azospirillaceae bacterium]
MEYKINSTPEATEILLSGRMTFSDHEKFRNVIATFDGQKGHQMVFDLSGLDFVDSSGLGMLIIARDIAQKKSLTFCLRGARDDVQRVMKVAKFNKMFTIID